MQAITHVELLLTFVVRPYELGSLAPAVFHHNFIPA
jgi:hypothetical protein